MAAKEESFEIIKNKYADVLMGAAQSEPIAKKRKYKYSGLHHQTKGHLSKSLKLKSAELNTMHKVLKELQSNVKTEDIASIILHALGAKVYSARAAELCVNGRKVLEAICCLFNVNRGTLAERIETLSNKVPEEKKMPMDEVNYLRFRGNDGAHMNHTKSDEEYQRIMREIIVSIRVVAGWVRDNIALPDQNDEKTEPPLQSAEDITRKLRTELSQFPRWIRSFAEGYGIHKFNLIQKRVISDLRSGKTDLPIICCTGSKLGKIMAVILFSLYLLQSLHMGNCKKDANIVFLTGSGYSRRLRDYASELRKSAPPHINIIEGHGNIRKNGWPTQGLNVIVCSINDLQKVRVVRRKGIYLSVAIFGSCQFEKIRGLFQNDVNDIKFVSSSNCRQMERNIVQFIESRD
eukprot:244980_1